LGRSGVDYGEKRKSGDISWAVEEFSKVNLEDKRLNKRCQKLASDLEQHMKACDSLRRKEQRDRERRTQITVFASIAAAAVFSVLGAFGLVKSNEATSQAATAQANLAIAQTAQADARLAEATAISNEREARTQADIALARQLAAEAYLINLDHPSKQMTAALIAIQSMNLFPTDDAARYLINNNLSALPVSRMAHDGEVTSVAFSPDGKYVVPGSVDGTARVWEAGSGKEVARMTHDDLVRSVAFSPDGKYVVSGSVDGTARVWVWQVEDLIANACKVIPRNLTRAEWNLYIGDALPYQAVCPNLPIEE
jgi:hypothetical protein